MSSHFIRHIPGMGHQVVHRKHGVKATFDDRDEALAHKDELDAPMRDEGVKEHEQNYWGQ